RHGVIVAYRQAIFQLFSTAGSEKCPAQIFRWLPPQGVAQTFNLRYRRFSIGSVSNGSSALVLFGRPAECNSAIQQIENLRYVPARSEKSEMRTSEEGPLCLPARKRAGRR